MSSRFWNSYQPFFNTASPFDHDPFFNTGISERQEVNNDQSQIQQQQSNRDRNLSQQQQQQQLPQQQPDTTLQTRPSQQRSWGGHDSWLSPFGRSSSLFDDPFVGGGFGSIIQDMNHMMRRMDRFMQQNDLQDDRWASGPGSESYSCSSSSFSQTGADGKTISRESRNERRRVGDVLEEQSHFKDSNGNERSTIRRGLNDQLKETIIDRNSRGEERKVENLKGLKPEEVQQFDQKWSERVSSQQRLLGQQPQQQQQLSSGGQRNENPRLTSTPSTKLESGGDSKPANITSQTRTQAKAQNV